MVIHMVSNTYQKVFMNSVLVKIYHFEKQIFISTWRCSALNVAY